MEFDLTLSRTRAGAKIFGELPTGPQHKGSNTHCWLWSLNEKLQFHVTSDVTDDKGESLLHRRVPSEVKERKWASSFPWSRSSQGVESKSAGLLFRRQWFLHHCDSLTFSSQNNFFRTSPLSAGPRTTSRTRCIWNRLPFGRSSFF